MSTHAAVLVCAHVLDPDTHSAQARQCLQRVEILVAVPAVPATRVALDRADQPDLLVVAQCRLTEPAAPGYILNGESCHTSSRTDLKRLRSRLTLSGRTALKHRLTFLAAV